MIADDVAFRYDLFHQFRVILDEIANCEKYCRGVMLFSASRILGVLPFSYPASKVR